MRIRGKCCNFFRFDAIMYGQFIFSECKPCNIANLNVKIDHKNVVFSSGFDKV